MLIVCKKMLTSAKLRMPWYQKVYFLKLHVCVYLRTKFEVFSLILTSFKQGVILPCIDKYILPEIHYQNLFHQLGIFKVPFMNSFQLFLILSLCVCICIYEFSSLKPSHFYVFKVNSKAANTAHSYHLKSCTIYSQ